VHGSSVPTSRSERASYRLNQHRVKVLADIYLDQQRASTRSLLHFRFAIINGHTQEQSEYPKVPNSDISLSAADTLGEWR
jgi:hypothetical protein